MNLEKLKMLAAGVALTSEGAGGRVGFRLGAILVNKNGRPVAFGVNQLKTHPYLKRLSSYPFLHAESNSILKHGLDHCRDHTLIVTRVLRNGKLANAKPCPTCEKLIKIAGISKVYFTNQNGELICAST